jgi:hypothetical protein
VTTQDSSAFVCKRKYIQTTGTHVPRYSHLVPPGETVVHKKKGSVLKAPSQLLQISSAQTPIWVIRKVFGFVNLLFFPDVVCRPGKNRLRN